MNIIKLNDCVQLKHSNTDLGVSNTDIGAVVDIQNNGSYFCVEFIDENGATNEKALNHYFHKDELLKVSNEKICDDSVNFDALCKDIDSMTDKEFALYLETLK